VLTSFNAAHIRLGSTEMLIVSVRPRILDDDYECELIRIAFEVRYRVPVVVMAQDERAQPRYRGRPKHVAALRGISPMSLPWQRFLPGRQV
jgi:hypothetical protein